MAARRSNDRYLPGIRAAGFARRDRDARGRRRSIARRSSRRPSRRCPTWRASSPPPVRARRSSGCRRDSSSFRATRGASGGRRLAHQHLAPMWSAPVGRDLGTELCRRGRPRIADGGGGRRDRRRGRRPRGVAAARGNAARLRKRRHRRRRGRRRRQERARHRRRRERRSRLRSQRARRAHHARTRGDRPPWRRARAAGAKR